MSSKDPSLQLETRISACWLLGQLAQKRSVASLLIAFVDPRLTWEAAKALGVINTKRAVKP
jgi:HEAT repeat protein